MPEPPVAQRHPHRLESHGHVRVDDWYWLADRDNPEVRSYLEAENAYTDSVLAPTVGLQQQLFEEIKARVVETDAGPPARNGAWWYWSRTVEGLQYPIMSRRHDPGRALVASDVVRDARSGRPASETGEQVILDQNELAGSSDYLALGVFDVSPDQRLLAYGTDLDGSERYLLRFRDLGTGEHLDDTVEGVYYGSAWAAAGDVFFYVRPDAAMRPWQVWRHRLGAPASDDVLVFQEDDERFFVEVSLERSERVVVIHSSSKTTSEAHWLDAEDPESPPRVVLPREPGVEYDVEHAGDSWLVRTNRTEPGAERATNFAVWRLPMSKSDAGALEPFLRHRPDVRVDSVDAFSDFVVIAERHTSDGLERLQVLKPDGSPDHFIEHPEPVYSLTGQPNPEWESPTYRFGYTSLVTPMSSVEHDPSTRRTEAVWSQQVRDYDASLYRSERLWAGAPDGTRIPVSLVAKKEVGPDGTAPCLLYGYGSYEMSIDATFSALRVNLLERGMVFAIAHVRGGGELGRAWYEQGRMEHKTNTFNDFVAAAEHLVSTGWAREDALVARGGSAGGLLMGAVANLRPDLWRAIVAEVPFVDVVTTMSDTSLPLTVTEWEEWGDPLHDPDAYQRMLAYSPYDNVSAGPHPAMYVTAGLNDPRVGYWEPAKWVAKLRSLGVGSAERPVLLRTELGAGHQGSSGRYDAWRDEARIQAFILDATGAATASPGS